jgi:hypothetical protein
MGRYNTVTYVMLALTIMNLCLLKGCTATQSNLGALALLEAVLGIVKIGGAALLLGPLNPTCPSDCKCIGDFVSFYPFVLIFVGCLWLFRAFQLWGAAARIGQATRTVATAPAAPLVASEPVRSLSFEAATEPNQC